jgi:hypothetical protein
MSVSAARPFSLAPLAIDVRSRPLAILLIRSLIGDGVEEPEHGVDKAKDSGVAKWSTFERDESGVGQRGARRSPGV